MRWKVVGYEPNLLHPGENISPSPNPVQNRPQMECEHSNVCLQCSGGRAQWPLIQLAPLHIILYNYQYGIFTSDSIVAFIWGENQVKNKSVDSKVLSGGYLIQDCGGERGLSTHVAHIEHKCQNLFIVIIPLCCIIGKNIDVSPFYLLIEYCRRHAIYLILQKNIICAKLHRKWHWFRSIQ